MDSKIESSRKGGRPKGLPKTGGRKPGTPNKATGIARQAFATFVDNNAERLQKWLDDIAANEKHGPKAAFDCLMQVAEYHVPKLARTEHVGSEDKPIRYVVTWKK